MKNEFEDIKQLTRRFMDGQTTIEEEDRLAAYYRTHDVPEEWREYKEMFAYFDAGMPLGDDKPAARPMRRPLRVWLGAAAAAAVVVMAVMLWPRNEMTAPEIMPQTAMTAPVADADTTGTAEADTTILRIEQPAPKPVRRRIDRYRYKPAPPKTYLAKVNNIECSVPADSIAAADKILAEKMRDIEAVSEELLRDIETLTEVEVLEMAGVDYDAEEESGEATSDNEVLY